MINYKTMYELKNYLLSIQSHWMINQPTYKAVQETMPIITKYKAGAGQEDMPKTPVHKVVKKIYPEIYKVPLFRRHFCNLSTPCGKETVLTPAPYRLLTTIWWTKNKVLGTTMIVQRLAWWFL